MVRNHKCPVAGVAFLSCVLPFLADCVMAQTRPDLSSVNVVMRNLPGARPEGDYELYTIKDGQVLHTERIGAVAFYAKSHDRLVTITALTRDDSQASVFELPAGNKIALHTLKGLWCGELQQGADEWGAVDQTSAYFTGYQDLQKGVFAKIDLASGAFDVQLIPPHGGGPPRLAGDFIYLSSFTATSIAKYSIAESKFGESIPALNDRRYTLGRGLVFVPQDGLYAWNVLGEFTRLADESLNTLPDVQRQPQTIARGVLAVQTLSSAAAQKVVIILTGPNRNGAVRGEAIEAALIFAKPSEHSILATIPLSFTPTHRIFRTGDENVIAVVNEADGSVVKFDCVAHKEVGRIVLPPLEGHGRPEGIQVIH